MRSSHSRVGLVLVALALVAAACSDSDGDTTTTADATATTAASEPMVPIPPGLIHEEACAHIGLTDRFLFAVPEDTTAAEIQEAAPEIGLTQVSPDAGGRYGTVDLVNV